MAKLGFNVIEVGCYIPELDFVWHDKKNIDELVKVCDDYGITIWSAHPPENDVLLMPDHKARQDHFELLKRFADFCNQVGAAYMPIHFWLPKNKFEEAGGFTCFDEVVAELCTFFDSYHVLPCLETLRSNASAISNSELLAIVKKNDSRLGMLLDTGHAQISNELHAITLNANRSVKSLHLHDNDGVQDLHRIPGTGVTDWTQFATDLKTIEYNGPIIFEHGGNLPKEKIQPSLEQTMDFYRDVFRQTADA